MTASVISAELFKLRTVRGPWAVGAALAGLVAAMLVFNAALLGDPGQPTLVPDMSDEYARVPGRLTAGAALLLGLMLTTSEHRYRTILTTRLVRPKPAHTMLGKAAAAAIAGALVALAVEVIALAGSVALFASRDVAFQPLHHGVPAVVGSVVAVAALHAVAGVGIGELLRNPALAVGAVLGWVFIVEAALPSVLGEPDLNRWLPAGAADAALAVGLPRDAAALAPAGGLALLAGYVAVLLLAGAARARVSDP